MRRDVGAVLAGLGTLLIVMAVVLPTYIVGQVAKFPLSEYETATLTGTGMSYFSATKVATVTGADVRATYTIKGDPAVDLIPGLDSGQAEQAEKEPEKKPAE